MARSFSLTEDAFKRVARVVKQVERQPRNFLPQLEKRVRLGGESPSKCAEVDLLAICGPVTSGSVTLNYTFNEVAEDIEIQWNSDSADALTAFEGHSEVSSGDVQVVGGPWPSVALHVIYGGNLKGTTIPFPYVSDDLAGDGAFSMWKASSVNWKNY